MTTIETKPEQHVCQCGCSPAMTPATSTAVTEPARPAVSQANTQGACGCGCSPDPAAGPDDCECGCTDSGCECGCGTAS